MYTCKCNLAPMLYSGKINKFFLKKEKIKPHYKKSVTLAWSLGGLTHSQRCGGGALGEEEMVGQRQDLVKRGILVFGEWRGASWAGHEILVGKWSKMSLERKGV